MPGIGPKSAERLAFYILGVSRQEAEALSSAILEIKDKVSYCRVCNNLSESDTCPICQDPGRDRSIICVVEEPSDVLAIEKTGGFRGLYHILLGALSPLEGIGPGDIRIDGLITRLKSNRIKEVIIATNPDTEGEATALYLTELIKPLGLKTTRIAAGIPVGGRLESVDQATLSKALEGRRQI